MTDQALTKDEANDRCNVARRSLSIFPANFISDRSRSHAWSGILSLGWLLASFRTCIWMFRARYLFSPRKVFGHILIQLAKKSGVIDKRGRGLNEYVITTMQKDALLWHPIKWAPQPLLKPLFIQRSDIFLMRYEQNSLSWKFFEKAIPTSALNLSTDLNVWSTKQTRILKVLHL